MKNNYFYKSVFLLLIYFMLAMFSFETHANAWFGAGSTSGWTNTYDGLKGVIIPPLYNEAPNSYTINQSITINTQIQDPKENTQESINKNLYLKLFKITNSPINRYLNYPDASSDFSINEDEFYMNNYQGNDYQSYYATFSLGNLSITPGQNSTLPYTFSIADPGYYQFDITDLDGNTGYQPGHIYVAGFLRIINTAPTLTPTPTNTPSTNSGGNSSESNNSSSSTTVCNDTAPSSAPVLTNISSNTTNSVTLSWTKALDPVSYYLIAYGTRSGEYKFGNPNAGDKTTTSYTVNGLSGDTVYYFVVRAGNGCKPGAFSNELYIKPTGTTILSEPAQNFSPGVLGTINNTKNKPSNKLDVKGVAKSLMKDCTIYLFWPILLGQIAILSLYYYNSRRKNLSFKQNLIIGAIISICAYIIFILFNSGCPRAFIELLWLSSTYRSFLILSIIVFLTYIIFIRKIQQLPISNKSIKKTKSKKNKFN